MLSRMDSPLPVEWVQGVVYEAIQLEKRALEEDLGRDHLGISVERVHGYVDYLGNTVLRALGVGSASVERLNNPFYPYGGVASHAESRLFASKDSPHSFSFMLLQWSIGVWEGLGLNVHRAGYARDGEDDPGSRKLH
ncbi:uncharacterized protein B0H18DRAFT_1121725 [Fomitopsis serialis]|uniref:uncharacterized protein n=1 Tax=Fomitopsis serialis TaxID=139415 RepID=UPI002008433E|nr:uncharacterized protein B0H18DRAFT_1121725 [Neoantrodia serialis]KAH9920764.1 hypothetical protein B0H18DRAFT_1121725 [Neoantrodia serialis]